MAIWMIAYDLRGPETRADYRKLIQAIESVPHCHEQGSLWFVEHPGPAPAIRDALMPFLDQNDSLFVDRVTNEWAARNTACGNWLNARGL